MISQRERDRELGVKERLGPRLENGNNLVMVQRLGEGEENLAVRAGRSKQHGQK